MKTMKKRKKDNQMKNNIIERIRIIRNENIRKEE